jgi:thiamine-phosphate pyrophosphorylase
VPLIINDRFDIALLSHADGVHLGQSDLPCKEVRTLAGEDFLIGVSAATVEEAVKAKSEGADYLGVGAMYSTATKTNTRPVTIERLKEIRRSVDIPIVAIGGIKESRIPDFAGTGINGFAVVSAVVAAQDIESAARNLRHVIVNTKLK